MEYGFYCVIDSFSITDLIYNTIFSNRIHRDDIQVLDIRDKAVKLIIKNLAFFILLNGHQRDVFRVF